MADFEAVSILSFPRMPQDGREEFDSRVAEVFLTDLHPTSTLFFHNRSASEIKFLGSFQRYDVFEKIFTQETISRISRTTFAS